MIPVVSPEPPLQDMVDGVASQEDEKEQKIRNSSSKSNYHSMLRWWKTTSTVAGVSRQQWIVIALAFLCGMSVMVLLSENSFLRNSRHNKNDDDNVLFTGRQTSVSSRSKLLCNETISTTTDPSSSSSTTTTSKTSAVSFTEDDLKDIEQKLSCLDPNGPQPVILMTLGRSGSSSTWQLMGNLTGGETYATELPGESPAQQIEFIQYHDHNDTYPGQWMVDYLCTAQTKYPTAGIIGFKWKPFEPKYFTTYDSWKGPMYLIAGSTAVGKPIKVIRSKRNPLDVYISFQKHQTSSAAPSHCKVGNKKCLKKHKKASANLQLKTTGLIQRLNKTTINERQVDEMLIEMGIPHIQVEYERLYFNYYAPEEWERILQFLGHATTTTTTTKKKLTLTKLERSMNFAPTHASPTQRSTVSNYNDLVHLLEGTEFERLLH